MDSYAGDFGEVVLDVAAGGWEPAFEAALAHPVGDLLVMDRVVLEPAWRGFGLGPVLAGAAKRDELPLMQFIPFDWGRGSVPTVRYLAMVGWCFRAR